jgi:small subunit ribosomal protein S4e
MGKKGPTRHLKREMTPPFWPIHRKERVWAVRASPGPHGLKVSSPLLVVIRDFLGYAETAKEATMLIKEGKVLVDGKTRRDIRYSVGLMDVVHLTDSEEYFRVLPEHGGRFVLHPISQDEAKFKLCQIAGKTKVKGGRTQINLHDGRNMILGNIRDTHRTGLRAREQEDRHSPYTGERRCKDLGKLRLRSWNRDPSHIITRWYVTCTRQSQKTSYLKSPPPKTWRK